MRQVIVEIQSCERDRKMALPNLFAAVNRRSLCVVFDVWKVHGLPEVSDLDVSVPVLAFTRFMTPQRAAKRAKTGLQFVLWCLLSFEQSRSDRCTRLRVAADDFGDVISNVKCPCCSKICPR
jgi:hypothetical protein